jgi:hypothetical protein
MRCELVQQLEASSDQELQLKGASQGGQEPLDMKAKDATPLEIPSKQCCV